MSNVVSAAIAASLVTFTLGCGGAPPTAPLSNSTATTSSSAPTSSSLFTIEAGSIGPITGATKANLHDLRAVLGPRGLTVTPVNNSGVEFHAFLAKQLVLYVIPNDDGSLFNVHVVSDQVSIAKHPAWRIGHPLVGSGELDRCECWGEHPVCFKTGEHVGLGFKISCDDLDDASGRKALEGVPIQRAVWSPGAFGEDGDEGGMGGDGYGGVVGGDPCGGDPCGGDPCGGDPCGGDPCGGDPCGP